MDNEVLVVLAPSPDAALREAARRIGARFHVVSTLGARLLVLRAGADAHAEIVQLPGVQAVAADAHAVAGLHGLDENEQLFAAAWAAQGAKSGPRRGAGLDWDAPGFEPPGR